MLKLYEEILCLFVCRRRYVIVAYIFIYILDVEAFTKINNNKVRKTVSGIFRRILSRFIVMNACHSNSFQIVEKFHRFVVVETITDVNSI